MAAQKGSAYLLKTLITATQTTIAGARTVSFNRTRTPVDVTNADSSELARELLSTAGVKQGTFQITGVFTDNATDANLETDFEAGTLKAYEFVVPDFGTYTSSCIITALEHSGSYQEGGAFSMTLESGAAWTFVAA